MSVNEDRKFEQTLDLELIQQAIECVTHAQTLTRDYALLVDNDSMVTPHYLSVTFANLKAAERNLLELHKHLESEVKL